MQNLIKLEDYFNPGFKSKPAVWNGSQTLSFWHGSAQEQAWEGTLLAGASKTDLAIVRDFDPGYIRYWKELMDYPKVINLDQSIKGEYLTQVLLADSELLAKVKEMMDPKSKLMVFLPTSIEELLAQKLGIPLHGSANFSDKYGTKSGIRKLAEESNIAMPPGYICTTVKEAEDALDALSVYFDEIVIKHDHSASGYFSRKLQPKSINNLREHLNEIIGREFTDGEESIVVEGWVQSKASLCAHIEILEDQDPIVCAAWQQVIDTDGITYMGGGPLSLSKKAFDSFMDQVTQLAKVLKSKGAVGSFGPDFLIISDNENTIEADTSVLIELNARAPYTAFPLEIIKLVKGRIGDGFFSSHIKVAPRTPYSLIAEILTNKGLLIKNKGEASGVVPYNIGLLEWGIFDIVVMAESWEKTQQIFNQVENLFNHP